MIRTHAAPATLLFISSLAAAPQTDFVAGIGASLSGGLAGESLLIALSGIALLVGLAVYLVILSGRHVPAAPPPPDERMQRPEKGHEQVVTSQIILPLAAAPVHKRPDMDAADELEKLLKE